MFVLGTVGFLLSCPPSLFDFGTIRPPLLQLPQTSSIEMKEWFALFYRNIQKNVCLVCVFWSFSRTLYQCTYWEVWTKNRWPFLSFSYAAQDSLNMPCKYLLGLIIKRSVTLALLYLYRGFNQKVPHRKLILNSLIVSQIFRNERDTSPFLVKSPIKKRMLSGPEKCTGWLLWGKKRFYGLISNGVLLVEHPVCILVPYEYNEI
jgi:hypothetical protein